MENTCLTESWRSCCITEKDEQEQNLCDDLKLVENGDITQRRPLLEEPAHEPSEEVRHHLQSAQRVPSTPLTSISASTKTKKALADLPPEILKIIFRHLLLINPRRGQVPRAEPLELSSVQPLLQEVRRRSRSVTNFNHFVHRKRDLLFRGARECLWPEILQVCHALYALGSAVILENEVIAIVSATDLRLECSEILKNDGIQFWSGHIDQIHSLQPMVTFQHSGVSRLRRIYYFSIREAQAMPFLLRRLCVRPQSVIPISISIDNSRIASSKTGIDAVGDLLYDRVLPWMNDLIVDVKPLPTTISDINSLSQGLPSDAKLKDSVNSLARANCMVDSIAQFLRNQQNYAVMHDKTWDIGLAATITEDWAERLLNFRTTGEWTQLPGSCSFEREAASMIALLSGSMYSIHWASSHVAEFHYLVSQAQFITYLVGSMGARGKLPPSFQNICRDDREQLVLGSLYCIELAEVMSNRPGDPVAQADDALWTARCLLEKIIAWATLGSMRKVRGMIHRALKAVQPQLIPANWMQSKKAELKKRMGAELKRGTKEHGEMLKRWESAPRMRQRYHVVLVEEFFVPLMREKWGHHADLKVPLWEDFEV